MTSCFRPASIACALLLSSSVSNCLDAYSDPPRSSEAVGTTAAALQLGGWFTGIVPGGILVGHAEYLDDRIGLLRVGLCVDTPPGPDGRGGNCIAEVTANHLEPNLRGLGWTTKESAHRFTYRIPHAYRDGVAHRWYACAWNAEHDRCTQLGPSTGYTFKQMAGPNYRDPVFHQGHECEGQPCLSVSNDFGAPAYPGRPGWAADSINYFHQWGCTSQTGIDTIVRLNISPFDGRDASGTPVALGHGRHFVKDSTFLGYEAVNGANVIYFSSTRGESYGFTNQKAHWNPTTGRFDIHDVLVAEAGHVSSFDGFAQSYLFNDYALPGIGPSANRPASDPLSRIPGTAEKSANPDVPSYPLVGKGGDGLGISGIRTLVLGTDSPTEATCIHQNPALFDFGPDGKARRVAVELFWYDHAEANRRPCRLPDGRSLPRVGTYVYVYQGPELGWHLEPSLTPLEINDTNGGSSPFNHVRGTTTKLMHVVWPRTVEILDANAPVPRQGTSALECIGAPTAAEAAGLNGTFGLGEPSGAADGFVFVAVDPYTWPHTLGASRCVTADPKTCLRQDGSRAEAQEIFYAFRSAP